MTVPSELGGVHETEILGGERATALTPDTGSGAEEGERRMRRQD